MTRDIRDPEDIIRDLLTLATGEQGSPKGKDGFELIDEANAYLVKVEKSRQAMRRIADMYPKFDAGL